MTAFPPLSTVKPTAALLKALADDNRLRILALLAQGEYCVCHLTDALGLTQPNVSQHLTVLRNAGLVDGERRGTWTWYRLLEQEPTRARILAAVLDGLSREDDASRLQESLQERTCP